MDAFEAILKEEVRSSILGMARDPTAGAPMRFDQSGSKPAIFPHSRLGDLHSWPNPGHHHVTLGSTAEEQRLDSIGPEDRKRYIHHYNFPPFSVGEVRRLRGTSRRDIGHGALAERALLP